jgi:hypothetical protein
VVVIEDVLRDEEVLVAVVDELVVVEVEDVVVDEDAMVEPPL